MKRYLHFIGVLALLSDGTFSMSQEPCLELSERLNGRNRRIIYQESWRTAPRVSNRFQTLQSVFKALEVLVEEGLEDLIRPGILNDQGQSDRLKGIFFSRLGVAKDPARLHNAIVSSLARWNIPGGYAGILERLGLEYKPELIRGKDPRAYLYRPEFALGIWEDRVKSALDTAESAMENAESLRILRQPDQRATLHELHVVMNYLKYQSLRHQLPSEARERSWENAIKIRKLLIAVHEAYGDWFLRRRDIHSSSPNYQLFKAAVQRGIRYAIDDFDSDLGSSFTVYANRKIHALFAKVKKRLKHSETSVSQLLDTDKSVTDRFNALQSTTQFVPTAPGTSISTKEVLTGLLLKLEFFTQMPGHPTFDGRVVSEVLRRRLGIGLNPDDYAEVQTSQEIASLLGCSHQNVSKIEKIGLHWLREQPELTALAEASLGSEAP